EAHWNLGKALGGQGKWEAAVAAYREAIRLRPDLAEAHNNLGATLYDDRNGEEAADDALHAPSGRKHNLADAHYHRRNALGEQGRSEAAVAAYREALRLRPDDPEAHSNLGAALHDQGKWEAAAAEFREALRLRPDDPEAHNNLGIALHDQGKREAAVAEF